MRFNWHGAFAITFGLAVLLAMILLLVVLE